MKNLKILILIGHINFNHKLKEIILKVLMIIKKIQDQVIILYRISFFLKIINKRVKIIVVKIIILK
jgi:hypothetical protein